MSGWTERDQQTLRTCGLIVSNNTALMFMTAVGLGWLKMPWIDAHTFMISVFWVSTAFAAFGAFAGVVGLLVKARLT